MTITMTATTKFLPKRNPFTISARYSSQSLPRQNSLTADHATPSNIFPTPAACVAARQPPSMPKPPPLSMLPLSSVLRSLATASISSSPILLPPSLALMSILAHSKSPLLSPDTNPLLRLFLKATFYRQFCAGENAPEVTNTISTLKSLGFKGVILGYAKEVVLSPTQKAALSSCGLSGSAAEACIQSEILPWAKGTLETVRLTAPGDFVALKFTGAGSQALYALSQCASPSVALKDAIDSVCDAAAERGVRLLFDAEQASLQGGIDAWTLEYMRRYNGGDKGAVIYGTYQAYLKGCAGVLGEHLRIARREGFTLGVKLVRGAYIGSDPRELICDTKEDTDKAYDSISESLVRRRYGDILRAAEGEEVFPKVSVVLAGHNHSSVRKVMTIRKEQAEKGEKMIDLVYAQLQGMADEVSCELVQAGQVEGGEKVDVPQAYKYLVWGTTGECMKYLLRRAQENKDAVQRTREGRDAMASELVRRVKAFMRLSLACMALGDKTDD